MILYLVEVEYPHKGCIEVDVIKEDNFNYFVELGFFSKLRFSAHKTRRDALYYCATLLQTKASAIREQEYNMWIEVREQDFRDAQKAKKGEEK